MRLMHLLHISSTVGPAPLFPVVILTRVTSHVPYHCRFDYRILVHICLDSSPLSSLSFTTKGDDQISQKRV